MLQLFTPIDALGARRITAGHGATYRTLNVAPNCTELPADLCRAERELPLFSYTKGETDTWFSGDHGDQTACSLYLRRYASGHFAIHIGTWYSRDDLIRTMDVFRKHEALTLMEMFQHALIELDRRILIMEYTVQQARSS
jgi:hypothetical protein